MYFITSFLLAAINMSTPTSLHDFKIQRLDSEETLHLSDYAGKKILIVNVASRCGYTSQYEDLQQLYSAYQDKLEIVGFPCNQFANQESGSEATIAAFCNATYGVTFPMTTKVHVKGSDQHPIYQWLTQKEQNGVNDFKVRWNFNKFLIDEQGQLLAYFPSSVNPYDDEILKYFK